MSWLLGHWNSAWAVAAKAALLYGTALAGLRLTVRRTLAQVSLFDIITAVAIGAVIGRSATAGDTSYVEAAVALMVLIVLHRLVSLVRYHPLGARLTDHRVRVLVVRGRIRTRQLWIAGLTEQDLRAALRQHGIQDMAQVRYVLYERIGTFTVVRDEGTPGELVTTAVRAAAGAPTTPDPPR
jgi:uncharacterized membrane protein YcaP (DUF421 family)